MFTHKDIEQRTIFVINCIKERSLRVSNGELLLEERVEDGDQYEDTHETAVSEDSGLICHRTYHSNNTID